MNMNRALLQILSGDAGSRTEVVDFFVLVRGLYNFFKLANIRKLYNGQRLQRLIDTRWSGHLKAIRVSTNI